MSATIHKHELRAHVHRLSSPEFQGRRGAGAARASRHIADRFKAVGLRPAFGNSFFQPIPWLFKADGEENAFAGRNVVGLIPGRDASLQDEWIVLSAHFDHLGQDGDTLYPGADDNASGISMLLEVAERFALCNNKPKRTLAFVAFDQEEYGLLGSRHFANHPPLEIRKLKAFVTADLIGRSMHGLTDEYVFVLGAETSTQLRQIVNEVELPDGLQVGRLGADIIGTRSDYGPFRDKKIPFLFFSTGEHEDYHKPSDTADKLDYPKLTRVSRFIARTVERLADGPMAPRWREPAHDERDLSEVKVLHVILDRGLKDSRKLGLSQAQRENVAAARARLSEIMKRERITSEERAWLVTICRRVMLMFGRVPASSATEK